MTLAPTGAEQILAFTKVAGFCKISIQKIKLNDKIRQVVSVKALFVKYKLGGEVLL